MGSSLLTIAVTGLNAAQSNLLATSHNIANAATPGFNRQQVIQTTQTPQYTGAGFFGQGTNIVTVQRAYNQFLSEQVTSSLASSGELDTYATELRQIDNMLGDPTVGMSPAVTGFFKAVNEVAANPSSIPARQSMLAAARGLVARFQDIDARLTEISEGVNSQVTAEATTVNSLAAQIADVNQRIAVAEAGGSGQAANDLHDQRDQLINDLNTHIRATVVAQSDGSFSVFVGNGQPLVVSQTAFRLNAIPATNDPTRTIVSLTSPTGTTQQVPEELLSGGTLGGLLKFRRESLDDVRASLGRLAIGIAHTVNDQHRLGVDLTGAMGGDFFQEPVPIVVPDTGNPDPSIAPGTVSASITDIATLTTSDYLLTAANGGYTLLRLSDNSTVFTGGTLPITVDGMTIRVAGLPTAGASFKISPVRYGARDIAVGITDVRSIAAALAAKASAGIANTGTTQISPGELTTPLTLTYGSGAMGYSGFPAGTTLTVWDGTTATTTTVSSQSQFVALPTGSNVSVDGITFQMAGTPANGDVFTVGPNRLQSALTNTGGATISAGGYLASTTLTYGATGLTGFPIGSTVTVTNGATVTDYRIDLAAEAVPYTAGATYAYNGMRFTFGGAAPVVGDTFSVGDAAVVSAVGGGTIAALPPASGAALPAGGNPATFTYTLATNSLAITPPAAATGTVTVTAGGSSASYSAAGAIPFVAGATYTFAGLNFVLGGAPANGATFVVGQLPGTTSGTATVSQTATTFSAALPTSAYTLRYDEQSNLLTGFPPGATVSRTINGTTTLTRIATPAQGVSYTSGMVLTIGGVRVEFNGTPQNGDTFSIGPNSASTTDNRNMQALGALQTAKTMLGGTATYEASYAQLVSGIGNKAREVDTTSAAQGALLKQAQVSQQSFSGVNLDEEAANLLRFQQAYQAAAKMIDLSSKLFDMLIGLGR